MVIIRGDGISLHTSLVRIKIASQRIGKATRGLGFHTCVHQTKTVKSLSIFYSTNLKNNEN